MASQVLSGSSNPSYTNSTGQNVRILINYMASCTSMTWAGVTVTGTSSPVGKEVMTINGELRTVTAPSAFVGGGLVTVTETKPTGTLNPPDPLSGNAVIALSGSSSGGALIPAAFNDSGNTQGNIFYIPLTVTRGGSFPSELVLSNGQSFSATSGAYNIVVIREDGN